MSGFSVLFLMMKSFDLGADGGRDTELLHSQSLEPVANTSFSFFAIAGAFFLSRNTDSLGNLLIPMQVLADLGEFQNLCGNCGP